MSEANPQRDFALLVVRTLRDAGHEALWAGGCVRDGLLGKTPKDYDVATDAPPDRVREVFGKRRTVAVGAAFGVVTVLGPKPADPIEVATFRADEGYSDGRRPDAVRYTTAKGDAARRDFTINGLFYDPLEKRVIDYVGGRADLEAGVVRAIGNAEERFGEDRLRMLRAVRFAATLGFALECETADAVRLHAAAITDVSPERIGVEMKRMLGDPRRSNAVRLLIDTGLLAHVLPTLPKERIDEALRRLGRLDEASPALALATLLVEADPTEAKSAAKALKWTAAEWERVAWLVAHSGDLDSAPSRKWSEVQPLLADDGGAELVELRRALLENADATDAFCREKLAEPRERLDPPPLVVGADLIAAGLQPGPRFKELLAEARAAQLDGAARTKREALDAIGVR